MHGFFLSRRLAAAVVAAAVILAACGGDPGRPPGAGPREGSIRSLQRGAERVSLIQAQSELPVGRSVFTFGLAKVGALEPGNFLTGGTPEVWVARDEDSRAIGPFTARWYPMDAYERFGDRSPRTPFPGFYAAEVDIPAAGYWAIAAVVPTAEGKTAGSGYMEVKDRVVAPVGSRALSVRTPVARSAKALRRICTRTPPDRLHYISLDDALTNGKPTVVTFSTPALCESRMCGPVVDEVLAAERTVGRDKANFIHVEIYPGHDPTSPARAFLKWGFESEPWTIVIDRRGIIRARFEGPVAAPQIQDALRPLL